MDDTDLNLNFESKIKELIWHDITKKIDEHLALRLAQSQLRNNTCPSEETHDQLLAVEAICREIKQQLSQFDVRSAYQTNLDTFSWTDVLCDLLTKS